MYLPIIIIIIIFLTTKRSARAREIRIFHPSFTQAATIIIIIILQCGGNNSRRYYWYRREKKKITQTKRHTQVNFVFNSVDNILYYNSRLKTPARKKERKIIVIIVPINLLYTNE